MEITPDFVEAVMIFSGLQGTFVVKEVFDILPPYRYQCPLPLAPPHAPSLAPDWSPGPPPPVASLPQAV